MTEPLNSCPEIYFYGDEAKFTHSNVKNIFLKIIDEWKIEDGQNKQLTRYEERAQQLSCIGSEINLPGWF